MSESSISIIKSEVFLQSGARAQNGENIIIEEAFSQIQSDVLKAKTLQIRQFYLSNEDIKAKELKLSLPAVAFAATYNSQRKSGNEKRYNKLCVIDIDDLSLEDITDYRSRLSKDNHIIASWTSPSGRGIKGIVGFDFGDTEVIPSNQNMLHRIGFLTVEEYFKKEYNLSIDESGKDMTRLCFLSYDNSIDISDTFVRFTIEKNKIDAEEREISLSKKSVLSPKESIYLHEPKWENPQNRNSSSDRDKMRKIIKYLDKRRLSITYSYDEWYRVSFAISNAFTYSLGLKYFLSLSAMDSDKFDKEKCKRMLEYAYGNANGKISFGTIVYYAQCLGCEI